MSGELLVGVIGGSGLCQQDVFPVIDTVRPITAYGETSETISICTYPDAIGDTRTLAFLPRHGAHHTLAPHKIPYRANLAALRSLGVRQVLATCIAGSLRRAIRPGDLVVPDQFVNLTWGRDPDGPPELIHVPMADPYCPRLRALCAASGGKAGLRTHRRGTVAVIQGPRFSTTAESRWFTRPRLVPGEHDPVPRVLPGPRTRPVLRHDGDGHRLRRRRHPLSYPPLGGGERTCLGRHYAMQEIHLLLALLISRFQFTFPDAVPPQLAVTLRPDPVLVSRTRRRGGWW